MGLTEKLETYARVWAEVDLDAICRNMDHMKANLADKTQMIAVIKADGYGHGSVPVARALEGLPYLYGFATATYEEAAILRKAGVEKPILILGYVFPYCHRELIRQEIRAALFRWDSAVELSKAAVSLGKEALVHIKVDTGMSRIGIRPDDSGLEFMKRVAALPGIRVEGIFTHFAKADETDKTPALAQFERFSRFTDKVHQETGLHIPFCHCSNSAGIIRLPQANMDLVRAGIALYGLWPSEEVERDIVPLWPALSLKSHIVFVKELEEGAEVSYGGTFTAEQGMRVATIPVGYGDGYPRSLSGRGHVLIRGQRARILGRVCMDQMMVDVSHIGEVKKGDAVTLIGRDKEEEILVEDLARAGGGFHYEILCNLGKRIPRIYYLQGKAVGKKDYFEDLYTDFL